MILLLLGLLLTVIALPVSDKKDSSPEVKSSSFFSASSEKNTDAERTVLEKKLEGADNSVVSRNIVEGVMALFQLDAHKIKVMKMK